MHNVSRLIMLHNFNSISEMTDYLPQYWNETRSAVIRETARYFHFEILSGQSEV